MIDPELKYCTQCKDEYVPKIMDCPVCGTRLLTGREVLEAEEARERRLQGRAATIGPDDEVVTIRQGVLSDLKRLEELLLAEKIATVIVGDESSCGQGCCATRFFLQVKPEDARDALQVLEEEFKRTTALNHHDTTHSDSIFNPYAEETVCPACGYSFPPTTTTCPDCGLCFG